MTHHEVDILVVGAGIAGLATAYYLATEHKRSRILIVDSAQPMTLTSAQSGENYRNWWPHPTMAAFTDHSIDLMESIARKTGDRIHMTRRGYILATRDEKPDALLRQLREGYGAAAASSVRVHEGSIAGYAPPETERWQAAPDGVDVLMGRELIHRLFPVYDPEIATVLHIRRAGDISGQQLGQFMLETVRANGGRFQVADVVGISKGERFTVDALAQGARQTITCDILVNAAGPFASHLAAMHGELLPIFNVLQQKVAFPDKRGAISRRMPFSIDLDGQRINWSDDEHAELAADSSTAPLLEPMPGNIHCRPDGGEHGNWIKLGWAYNTEPSEPTREPNLNPLFPELVVRAASRLLPKLEPYIASLPRERLHYGGYYPMTLENWPLIGPAKTPGVFLAAALSGYGTMSACAVGDLVAKAIMGSQMPRFAGSLSLSRYDDEKLMIDLRMSVKRGIL